MSTFDDLDFELLERVFAGQATPEESARLERWIAAGVGRREAVEALRSMWDTPRRPPRGVNVSAMWGALSERIDAEERRVARAGRLRLTPSAFTELSTYVAAPWYRRHAVPLIAAAALLVAGVGGMVAWNMVARTGNAPSTVASQPAMREFVTARGERAELRLGDASRVRLGPATRLRIPADFGRTNRTVFLEGEAYFEVQHDSTRPFRVHAANGVAEDLGTEFVVTAYPETRGMRVVVASGEVALRAADTTAPPAATLVPGDLGRLDGGGKATVVHGVDLAVALAWVHDSLVFNGARLGDIIPTLSRWYDLDIRFADSARMNRRLTATFGGEPVRQMVDRLARTLDATVQWNGKAVLLSPVSQ